LREARERMSHAVLDRSGKAADRSA
jgi:hypothetical protein